MADRLVPNSLSTPPISGADYMDAVSDKFGILFNSIILKPTAITNTDNAYTMTIDPVLSGDVTEGMGFLVKPNANNTDAVTLRIGTNPYHSVVKASGTALASGEWNTSTYYFISFLDGAFRILSQISQAQVTSVALYQAFTSSGTWTKPTGLSNDAIVIVECWGAGGGGGGSGSAGGGGGGGAYVRKELRAGDLTSSVSVTVGTGGAGNASGVGNVGNSSSFGAYVQAFGGGGGGTSSGGGGGGATSAGDSGANGSASDQNGGGPVLVAAGGIITNSSSLAYGGAHWRQTNSYSQGSIFGGGAGAGSTGTPSAAGSSVYGGGGGASGSAAAGSSVFGGAGGASGVAGTAPAGGGGRTAAGARGEVRVRVIP